MSSDDQSRDRPTQETDALTGALPAAMRGALLGRRNAIAVAFALGGITVAAFGSRLPSIQASLEVSKTVIGTALMALTVGSLTGLSAAAWIHSRLGARRGIGGPLFRQGVLEVSGTEGTIVLPDPNYFGGRIAMVHPLKEFRMPPEQTWIEVPYDGALFGRGVGVLDLARAVRGGQPHVATGELGYHVLDTLVAIEESTSRGAFVEVESTVGPIGVLPADFDPFNRTL